MTAAPKARPPDWTPPDPDPIPARCRWCDYTAIGVQGIRSHERHRHPEEFEWAKHRPGETPPKSARKKPVRNGVTRPPDPALDELLARIDSNRHTDAGLEMYDRAARRTAAERDRMRSEYSTFNGAVYTGSYLDRGIR